MEETQKICTNIGINISTNQGYRNENHISNQERITKIKFRNKSKQGKKTSAEILKKLTFRNALWNWNQLKPERHQNSKKICIQITNQFIGYFIDRKKLRQQHRNHPIKYFSKPPQKEIRELIQQLEYPFAFNGEKDQRNIGVKNLIINTSNRIKKQNPRFIGEKNKLFAILKIQISDRLRRQEFADEPFERPVEKSL